VPDGTFVRFVHAAAFEHFARRAFTELVLQRRTSGVQCENSHFRCWTLSRFVEYGKLSLAVTMMANRCLTSEAPKKRR
jgi:hypothetical protein